MISAAPGENGLSRRSIAQARAVFGKEEGGIGYDQALPTSLF
jgi:hypothetical protein